VTWQLLLMTVIAHLGVVAAVFGLFYGVPSLARSSYRYRLWTLRDQIWDAVHRSDGVDVEEGERLLTVVESRIRSVHNWSAVTLLSAMYAIHRHKPEDLSKLDEAAEALPAAHGYQDPVLRRFAEDVEDLSIRYMRWATGFGWFRRPVVKLMGRWDVAVQGGAEDAVEAAGDSIDREFQILVASLRPRLIDRNGRLSGVAR
jgi:hypothetical protein